MFNKIKKGLGNPYLVLMHLGRHWPFRHLISDKQFLSFFYRAYHHRRIDWNNPQTFNEKLQWLKLYDRQEAYTRLTDKYLVRQYVKDKIGEQYLVPLLGVWNNPRDIDFSQLPNQFVLKCNHDSGSVIICHDKNKLNKKQAIQKLSKAFYTQYFWKSREYNYKNIQRKVIAEKLLVNEEKSDLPDYKIFCFNGKPKFIQVDLNRFTKHVRKFYTTDWNPIDVQDVHYNPAISAQRPECLNELLHLAHILSRDFIHVRVDFYLVGEQIYFGELTFHHGGGAIPLFPFSYDKLWGSYMTLPLKK